jgi:hypothetical protein
MSFQSIEFWLVALMITIAIVGSFGMFARWCATSPAVRPQQLDKLRVGMTAAEIVAIIGQPRAVKYEGEKQRWTYGAPMKRNVLFCDFDGDKLIGFTHGVPGQSRQRNPFPGA